MKIKLAILFLFFACSLHAQSEADIKTVSDDWEDLAATGTVTWKDLTEGGTIVFEGADPRGPSEFIEFDTSKHKWEVLTSPRSHPTADSITWTPASQAVQNVGLYDRFYATFSQGGVESGKAVSHGTLGAEMDLDKVPGLKLNAEIGLLRQWAGDNTGMFSLGLAYHLAPKRNSKFDPFLTVGYSRLFDSLSRKNLTTITDDFGDHFPPGKLKDREFKHTRMDFFETTGQDFVYLGGGVDYWFRKKVALRLSGRSYSPTDGAKQSLAEMAIGVVFRP